MQKNILNYNSVENIPHINAKAVVTEWQGSHIMPLILTLPKLIRSGKRIAICDKLETSAA